MRFEMHPPLYLCGQTRLAPVMEGVTRRTSRSSPYPAFTNLCNAAALAIRITRETIRLDDSVCNSNHVTFVKGDELRDRCTVAFDSP
jgi:hypothetical protein